MDARELARSIDHTLLRPDAVEGDIVQLCRESARYGFASACVASGWASLVKERLLGTGVRTCCVVGFPFGSGTGKAFEAGKAVEAGAEEIDMVMNVGYFKSGRLGYVADEIRAVVEASGHADVKVIIETCYLSDREKVEAARMAMDSGAAYVKTSTGYGPGGATLEDVRRIKREVPGIKIKASGGIRTFEAAVGFLEAGASRIGTSSGPAIMESSGQAHGGHI